ncbi:MAG: beta-galactosidase [bacterium]|nr:beta-galactosidase [bacterium]
MLHYIFRITIITIAVTLAALAAAIAVIPHPPKPDRFVYGTTFSKEFTERLSLDWKKTYLAILNDLGITTIRLGAYWDDLEPEEGMFAFDDLDWQIAEAQKRGIGVMLAVGQKLPRWPECHYPAWFREGDDAYRRPLSGDEQEKLLRYMFVVLERYRDNSAVTHWQVENEPFLPFGICPPLDEAFFDRQIALVRSRDTSRPLVISESGEFSTWMGAAKRSDILGSTLYRVVWWKSTGYVRYPIPEWFYWKKIWLIRALYPHLKDLIAIELQAEPWAHLQIYENTIDEMMKSMHPAQFVENLRFARAARFGTQYVWGAEWWYWMKEIHHQPYYWDYAGGVFRGEIDPQ